MSFLQFLRALRARFKVFVVAVSTVVLGTLIASVLMPKAYRATVALLVDTSDEQSLGEAARPLMLPQERLSYLQTQVDILTSRTVARKVVRDLNLLQSPAALAALGVKASGAGPLEERLVEQLLKQLKAETSQSSVIQARFSCADPLLSATIANGFAKAYIDTVLELRVAPTREAAAWFDEQLKSLRANLEEAQAKLAAYQQQAVSRYVAHGGSPDSLPEVANNTVIQQLKADVLRGDAKLKELATRYGVNHPQYQRVASENGALRARLTAAPAQFEQLEAGPVIGTHVARADKRFRLVFSAAMGYCGVTARMVSHDSAEATSVAGSLAVSITEKYPGLHKSPCAA